MSRVTNHMKSANNVVNADTVNFYSEAPGQKPEPPKIRQIPPPPSDLVGRDEELALLLADVEAGSQGSLIAGLHGLGGVGKTALACALADRLRQSYPLQFYLDLKGAGGQDGQHNAPLTPEDAMAHVIRTLRPQATPPQNPEQARADYLSLLDGQPALLLMDNALNAGQVEPLLPPASCFLLVTSRHRFSLPGLIPRDLNCLSPQAACELLQINCPRLAPAQAETIARLCGWLPLALRVAAATLAVQVDWEPEEYLQELGRRRGEYNALFPEVDAALSLSYGGQPSAAQEALRLLAVFPGDFDKEAALAVITGQGDPQANSPEQPAALRQAREHLTALVTASLVQFSQTARRYRLHDLVRDYAARKRTDTEHQTSALHHAQIYCNVLGHADDLYRQGGGSMLEGLALFDLEQENIMAGQAWAAAQSSDNTIARLVSGYSGYGAFCLLLRLHPQEQIRWQEHALAAARQLDDKQRESCCLGSLGIAYSYLGEAKKAIEFYEQALAINRQTGDTRGENNGLRNLANAYHDLGETKKAIEFYKQVLAIDRQTKDFGGEGCTLGCLGNAYRDLGEMKKAIMFYKQALVISRRRGDKNAESHDLGNLGTAYHNRGETKKAIRFYKQALVINQKTGDKRGESHTLGNLGIAYCDLGKTNTAIEFYEQALAITRQTEDRRGEGYALGSLGNAYYILGETRKAIEFYEQSLEISQQLENKRGEGGALGNLGSAYCALGEVNKAIEFYEQFLDITRQTEDKSWEGHALFNISLTMGELGQQKQAIEYAREAVKTYEQIESPHLAKAQQWLSQLQNSD